MNEWKCQPSSCEQNLNGSKHLHSMRKADLDMIQKLKKVIKFIKHPDWICRYIGRQLYSMNRKNNLRNRDFTIISNNCTAGFIYHTLNERFTSPTINLFFPDGGGIS